MAARPTRRELLGAAAGAAASSCAASSELRGSGRAAGPVLVGSGNALAHRAYY